MTAAVSEFIRASLCPVVPPVPAAEADASPDPWEQRTDDLLAIGRLEDDWDGMGAPAPSAALVDSAVQLAQVMRQDGGRPPCRVVAGLTGTVLFEWQQEDGTYFELEVTCPRQAEWVRIKPGMPTESGKVSW